MKSAILSAIACLLLFSAPAPQAASLPTAPLVRANDVVVLREDPVKGVTIDIYASQPIPNFTNPPIISISPFGVILPLDRPRFIVLPDGRLAVALDNLLHVLVADIIVETIDFQEQIGGLHIGPGGDIVVMLENTIVLWDLDAGDKTTSFDIADGTDPCLLPRDLLAFAVGPTIKVLDLQSGLIIRELVVNGEDIHGLARRSDGVGAVGAGSEVYLFDRTMEKVIAGPVNLKGSQPQPEFMPNGNVLVAGGNVLAELDGQTLATVQSAAKPVVGSAIGPHIFELFLEGFLATAATDTEDASFRKLKTTGTLSWAPGSGLAVVQIADPGAVAALGDNTVVLVGFEADDTGIKDARLVQGNEALPLIGAFGANVSGFFGGGGFYFAEKFTGQFQAAVTTNMVMTNMVSGAPLNP